MPCSPPAFQSPPEGVEPIGTTPFNAGRTGVAIVATRFDAYPGRLPACRFGRH